MIKKQTKIIATISDLKCELEFLKELYENGMDAVRLNTAHQTPEDTLKIIENVRKVSDRIAIIVDIKGPEIRTTKLEEPLFLQKGDLIKISGGTRDSVSSRDTVYVNYSDFVKDVAQGARILIDDGKLELEAIEKNDEYLLCRALGNGEIKGRKGVNTPGTHINLPSLSEKDKEYVLFSIEHNVDFIAHSFVRNKKDVMAVQEILDGHKSPIKIIAKIENQEGVENIDEILDSAYAIMVARGDMAVEISAEKVPLIQKKLIKKCLARNKTVITATQILQSMVKNCWPTRAEISDIANAVLDGTDALMLSDETTQGEYPVDAVRIMAKVARYAEGEKVLCEHSTDDSDGGDNKIADCLAGSAALAAKELGAKGIIVSTKSGYSAELISSFRGNVPIILKCFDKKKVREFALVSGVNAQYIDPEAKIDNLVGYVLADLVKEGVFFKEDLVIFLSSDLKEPVTTNILEVCRVGRYV
ncbi:MAG: pyruvate kinase [bacterium]